MIEEEDDEEENHETSMEAALNSSNSENNLTNNSISSDPASAKSTPTKKKPGRKKKIQTPEKGKIDLHITEQFRDQGLSHSRPQHRAAALHRLMPATRQRRDREGEPPD